MRLSEHGGGTDSLEAPFVISGRANNGMHPTPHHGVFHAAWAGARVMPGVRRLTFSEGD